MRFPHNGCMAQQTFIVGGGIGGLATALAVGRHGAPVQLLEQATKFGEMGAGIQLGPNVVRVLQAWGQGDALRALAAFPECLRVRNAMNDSLLGVLPLGSAMVRQYGAAYATIARADLHGLLLDAVRQLDNVQLHLASRVTAVAQDTHAVHLRVETHAQTLQRDIAADTLVGADGVWSQVRAQVVDDGAPRLTGHLAFRAMVPQVQLPQPLRSHVVTAWLGRDFHVVQYPVRQGEWLNVVAIVHGRAHGDPEHWDHSANAAELQVRLADAAPALQELIHALPSWRLWALSDRIPMQSAAEHARGRIALLGDAAHPMRPYLAQGAGMAIEDADVLAKALTNAYSTSPIDIPAALQRYANQRWQRNARVQARAIRNGEIFHLRGPMQVGRDYSLRLFGQKLLDIPWLYGGV